MRRRIVFAILAFILLLVFACRALAAIPLSPSSNLIVPTGTPRPTQLGAFVVPPNATGTPTPFQPGEMAVFLPTPTASVVFSVLSPSSGTRPPQREFPTPSITSDIPIPPPVELVRQPAGQVNLLLLGSDARPDEGGFRTDSIILLTLNPSLGTAHMTSFPRDLYVYVPGWTMQRINTALPMGGFELLADTFEYNLGVYPDHYILLDFNGFIHAVNTLGGLDIKVAEPLYDPWGYVPEGLVHMDGLTALWYVRSRYTTSDFDRARRQQDVLEAIFKKLVSLDAIKRAPELFTLYRDYFVTDLTVGDITPLIGLATELGKNPSRIETFFISYDQVSDFRVPSSGAQVLLPDYDLMMEVMREALNAPE